MTLLDIVRKHFGDNCHYRQHDGRVIIATEDFLPCYDESIALCIYQDVDGAVVITDCHTVTDYTEVLGVDMSKRSRAVYKIAKHNNMTFDGKVYSAKYYVSGEMWISYYLDRFLQAVKAICAVYHRNI